MSYLAHVFYVFRIRFPKTRASPLDKPCSCVLNWCQHQRKGGEKVPEKVWKRTERRIARLLGGQRVAAHGRRAIDVDAGWLQVEVKERRRLPVWIVSALARARAHAGDNQLGIVVLHEEGAHDDLVVLSLRDWLEWFGGAKGNGQDQDSE